MSAKLDRTIEKMIETGGNLIEENDRLRAELAQLRAERDGYKAQRDDFGPLFIRDLCAVLGMSDSSTLDEIMLHLRAQAAELDAMRESFAALKARNDELAQREIGYNAEIERRDLAFAHQAAELATETEANIRAVTNAANDFGERGGASVEYYRGYKAAIVNALAAILASGNGKGRE